MTLRTLVICVPTTRGWGPFLERTVAEMADQAAAVGASVLIFDGSNNPPPPDGTLPPVIDWRAVPNRSIVELRDDVFAAADGELVTITEDHVRIAPDWCAAILRAHAEHPEADVIGGPVDNDSRDSALDWAAFYAGYGPDLPPIPTDPANVGAARVSMINSSYKRRALRADPATLHAINDDRIQVWHRESYGVRGTTSVNFHSGRTVEGLRSREVGDGRALRAIRALALPVPRTARRLLTAHRKGQPVGRVARSAPWMLWLLLAQGFGEAIGALAGPGHSPRKVR